MNRDVWLAVAGVVVFGGLSACGGGGGNPGECLGSPAVCAEGDNPNFTTPTPTTTVTPSPSTPSTNSTTATTTTGGTSTTGGTTTSGPAPGAPGSTAGGSS